MNGSASVASAFSDSELFSGVDPAEVRGGFIMSFRRGDCVGETQNGIDCVGIVISGALEVNSSDSGSVSVMKRGGEFGICNIFVNRRMPTRITAKVKSSVLFIPKEEFARLLGADSGLMYRYVRLCNKKMLYLAERLSLLSVPDCSERLMHYLDLSQNNGVVKLGVTKDELARQLGISRSSLFRAFGALEADGRITVAAGTVVLSDNYSTRKGKVK